MLSLYLFLRRYLTATCPLPELSHLKRINSVHLRNNNKHKHHSNEHNHGEQKESQQHKQGVKILVCTESQWEMMQDDGKCELHRS